MSRLGLALGAAAAAAVLLYYRLTRVSRGVNRLIARSAALHQSHDYDASLEAALEACAFSRGTSDSDAQLAAMLHLAGVHAAQNKPSLALPVLDDALALAEAAHGLESLALVPILHAIAEVHEAAGAILHLNAEVPEALHAAAEVHVAAAEDPNASAASALGRARDIRRARCGENSLESARASYNLATLLCRGSHEGGLETERRSVLLERTVRLTLEACSVASAAGARDEAAECVGAVLDLLEDDPYEDELVEPAREKLRDAFREAAGEEWVGGDGGDEVGDEDDED